MPFAKPRPPLDPAMRAFCEAETVRLLPLIERLAVRSHLPFPIEDLVQEAAQAVFLALPRWDVSRGVKIETWLQPRICGAFRDYARSFGHFLKGGPRNREERVASLDHTVFETDSDRPPTLYGVIAAPRPRAGLDWGRLLKGFNRRDRLLVLEYFVHGRTMKSIARDLGLSEGRVSQRMATLLAHLRELQRTESRVSESLAS